jgi:hypothetical protein
MKTLRQISACLLLTLGVLPAFAQTQKIYRCGNSYSHQPCPGGSTIEADDSRTPAQRKAHQASVQREQHIADKMEKDRVKDEQAALHAAEEERKAVRTKTTAAKKAASPKKKRPADKEKLPAYKALAAPGGK